MNCSDFFNLIEIKDEDKVKAIEYIDFRGIEEHINVAKYLNEKLKRTPKYSEVASTFRYDKRIRRIIYKYLGFLEEICRAYISNNYPTITDLGNANELVNVNEKSRAGNTDDSFDLLCNCLFSTVINIYERKIKDIKDIKKIYPVGFIKERKDSLIDLRNNIGHNRFLLDSKSLSDIEDFKTYSSNKLERNMYNLISFLPNEAKQKFIKEINECDHETKNTLNNQVEWDLPNEIIIKLDINKRIK